MSELVIILILILLNGLLAMSEIALISVRKSYLSSQIRKGNKSAIAALKLANEPDNFLSTIQIGITVIGILTGIYSGDVLAADFGNKMIEMGASKSVAYPLAQVLIVVVVTYLTLVFGELLPKRIGMSLSGSVSKFVARPMYLLSLVFSPFVWLLAKSTTLVFNLFGLKRDSGKVTEEEIRSMIEEGTRDGEVQEVEHTIVERVFMMGDLKVSSLMTHRSEVTALDINMSRQQVREVVERDLCELYPVIDGSFDQVKGMLSVKDLIFMPENQSFNLLSKVSPALFFHENLSVYKALEQMKERKVGQALIYDEFGSCQGVISLKNILEGLVGCLDDTSKEPDIVKRNEDEGWLINGQCPFYDFLAHFDKEHLYGANNYNTVSGLILELLQHIPRTGERFEWEGLRFEIVDMDGVRIDKIVVC